MNEELNQSPAPTPPPQPVSMHDTPHKHHGALPLLTAMLGILLVLESIGLAYIVKEYVMDEQVDQMEEIVEDGETDSSMSEEPALVPPNLYMKTEHVDSPYGFELRQVDRQTGEDTLVLDFGSTKVGQLLAVPQVGYDGRIFMHIVGEGTDDPYVHLYELDLTDNSLVPTPVSLPISFGVPNEILNSHIEVSPDQTKLAYIPFNQLASEGVGPSPEIRIMNLLTGEVTTLVNLSDRDVPRAMGFTFAKYGENTIGGAAGVSFGWLDNSCIKAIVYELLSDTPGKSEVFCQE